MEWFPTIVIIAIIFLAVKWLSGDGSSSSGGEIRGITPATVETLHSAFPDIPIPNLIYSLSKTRSAQRTSEEIIEKGYLSAPPPSYVPPLSLLPPTVNPPSAPGSPRTSTPGVNAKTSQGKPPISLIDRYSLSNRLSSALASAEGVSTPGSGAGSGSGADSGSEASTAPSAFTSGRSTPIPNWADSKEARERGLRERKERMILEARRKLLEKKQQTVDSAGSVPS